MRGEVMAVILQFDRFGGPRPVIDRVFPFAEAVGAYACLASGAQRGRIVVRV